MYYLIVGLLNAEESNWTREPMKQRDVASTRQPDTIHTSHPQATRRRDCKFDVLDSSYMCVHVWDTRKAPIGPIRGSNVTSSSTGHFAACPPHFVHFPVWRPCGCSDTYCRRSSKSAGHFSQFDASRMAALPVAVNLASAERSRRLTAARTGGQQHPVQWHSSRWVMKGVPPS